jgi:4-carboxymuconolactone decarboxylase
MPKSSPEAQRALDHDQRLWHSAETPLDADRLSQVYLHDIPRTPAQQLPGDFAPALAQATDEVLFGEVWMRTQLSPRDHSLITCAALVVSGRTEKMDSHFPRAIANGVIREELAGLITHLVFYGGWPSAVSAVMRAKRVFGEEKLAAPS